MIERPQVLQYIEAGLESLRRHDLNKAQAQLDAALSIDFEHKKVVGLLKYIAYWKERQRILDSLPGNFEKSDYLLEQWAAFQNFIERVGVSDDDTIYALRHFVFGQSLNLLSIYNNEQGVKDPEVLRQVGVCLKGLGNYEAARKFLESANATKRDDPTILADLADAYALIEEGNLAKVLFREAFFIDPQKIRLETLESEMMIRLRNAVRDLGHSGKLLAEWMAVYGHVLGVFTVKRELRSIEYGKLLQIVYNLEREFMEGPGSKDLILPKLLVKYFWLVDHYSRSPEDRKRLQEVLLKIRSLSPKVYEQYTK